MSEYAIPNLSQRCPLHYLVYLNPWDNKRFNLSSSLGYCILIGHGFDIVSSLLEDKTDLLKQKTANGSSNYTDSSSGEEDTRPKYFRRSSCRLVLIAASGILLSALVLRTINRNAIWKNRETLFKWDFVISNCQGYLVHLATFLFAISPLTWLCVTCMIEFRKISIYFYKLI